MNKRKLNQIINKTIKKSKTEIPEYKPHNNHNNHNSHNNKKNNNQHNHHAKPVIVPVKKEQIPKRIREFVWNTYNGENYSSKCYVSWCSNHINVFNYQVGHDIPESKGGTMEISNLKPICGNCNLSMGNKYTITEWSQLINSTINSPIPTIPNTGNPHSIPDIKLDITPDINLNGKIKVNENLEKYMKKLLNKTTVEIDELTNSKSELNHSTPDTQTNKYKLIAGLSMVIMVLGLFV